MFSLSLLLTPDLKSADAFECCQPGFRDVTVSLLYKSSMYSQTILLPPQARVDQTCSTISVQATPSNFANLRLTRRRSLKLPAAVIIFADLLATSQPHSNETVRDLDTPARFCQVLHVPGSAQQIDRLPGSESTCREPVELF